jgi:hypothetical protein
MHQGSTGERLAKRDKQHVAAWSAFYLTDVGDHESELVSAREEIDRLRQDAAIMQQQLDDMTYTLNTGVASTAVINALETGRVRDADARTQAAYRSRDGFARTLWRIDALHGDSDRKSVCSGGERTEACGTCKLLEEARSFLYGWEAKEVERAREGLEHALPTEHPEARSLRGMRRYYG